MVGPSVADPRKSVDVTSTAAQTSRGARGPLRARRRGDPASPGASSTARHPTRAWRERAGGLREWRHPLRFAFERVDLRRRAHSTGLLKIPRFRGHPKKRECARGVFDGEANALFTAVTSAFESRSGLRSTARRKPRLRHAKEKARQESKRGESDEHRMERGDACEVDDGVFRRSSGRMAEARHVVAEETGREGKGPGGKRKKSSNSEGCGSSPAGKSTAGSIT
jgi:hypothetical protein